MLGHAATPGLLNNTALVALVVSASRFACSCRCISCRVATTRGFALVVLWFRRTIGAELSSDALRVFVSILSCKSPVPCEVYARRESFLSGSVSLSIIWGSWMEFIVAQTRASCSGFEPVFSNLNFVVLCVQLVVSILPRQRKPVWIEIS
jgi:hypothetical protein